jgi:hypothetical protein
LAAANVSPSASQHLLSTYGDFWAWAATGGVPLPVLVMYVAVCVCLFGLVTAQVGPIVVTFSDVCLCWSELCLTLEPDSSDDMGHSDSDAEFDLAALRGCHTS